MAQINQRMRHHDHHMVPKVLVQGMFALMIASTAIVAYAQWMDVPNRGVLIEAPVVQSLDIVLTGNRNGIYQIHDLNGTLLAMSSDNKAGFIGVMGKAIDRARVSRGVALDAPVKVVRRENGNIAIVDAATGMSTELIGYGVDNVAAFAGLLD